MRAQTRPQIRSEIRCLAPAHCGKGDDLAGVQGCQKVVERVLVDQANPASRSLALAQPLGGGLDHLLVQTLGQEQSQLLCGGGHGASLTGRGLGSCLC